MPAATCDSNRAASPPPFRSPRSARRNHWNRTPCPLSHTLTPIPQSASMSFVSPPVKMNRKDLTRLATARWILALKPPPLERLRRLSPPFRGAPAAAWRTFRLEAFSSLTHVHYTGEFFVSTRPSRILILMGCPTLQAPARIASASSSSLITLLSSQNSEFLKFRPKTLDTPKPVF